MQVSDHDDITIAQQSFQLGLTIKDWSRDKSQRDMHNTVPSFEESSHYHEYLTKIKSISQSEPDKVVAMRNTERRT